MPPQGRDRNCRIRTETSAINGRFKKSIFIYIFWHYIIPCSAISLNGAEWTCIKLFFPALVYWTPNSEQHLPIPQYYCHSAFRNAYQSPPWQIFQHYERFQGSFGQFERTLCGPVDILDSSWWCILSLYRPIWMVWMAIPCRSRSLAKSAPSKRLLGWYPPLSLHRHLYWTYDFLSLREQMRSQDQKHKEGIIEIQGNFHSHFFRSWFFISPNFLGILNNFLQNQVVENMRKKGHS